MANDFGTMCLVHDTKVSSVSLWPDFDFRSLPLCNASRKQLAGIYEHVKKNGVVPKNKTKLIDLLQGRVYDVRKGLYIPFSDTFYLVGKEPVHSNSLHGWPNALPKEPFKFQFFSNALLIPPDYGTDTFDLKQIASPTLRVTNAGFLVVTLEIDCDNLQEFEQNLAWTRGRNEDFSLSDLGRIDEYLCKFGEYRGFSIVFSGRRSFHFHFLFSTAHLEKCSHEALAADRVLGNEAGLMARVHEEYWDHVNSVFSETVGTANFDRKLRSVVQWRRTPWAVRTLDEPFEALGLRVGSRIPQIVIHEKIRDRAAKNSKSFFVPPSFSPVHPSARKGLGEVPPKVHATIGNSDVDEMLADLKDQCRLEWGEYPLPVKMDVQKGQWIFHFKNHEADAKPSTIVCGSYRKLQINGQNDFQQDFFLPGDLSAQEMGNYLAQKYSAQLPARSPVEKLAEPDSDQVAPISKFQAYLNRVRKPFPVEFAEGWAARFPEPIIEDKNELKSRYRRKLPPLIVQARALPLPMLIRSVEGIGKTTALRGILAYAALDYAVANGGDRQKFVAFAFRSRQQARQKANEFSQHGDPTVAIVPLWQHLNEVCDELGVDRMEREQFDSDELCEILSEIRDLNPEVYRKLEDRRKAIWSQSPFNGGTTLITMTHRAAQLWPYNKYMRAWHHPNFDPDADQAQVQSLFRDFDCLEIVFDDPEFDDFVHIIPNSLYLQLKDLQEDNPNWRNISRLDREVTYYSHQSELKLKSFYEFDALMRLDLDRLATYRVDSERYPYGQDNPQAKDGI